MLSVAVTSACLCGVHDLGCAEQQLDLLLSVSVAKALVQCCANWAFFSFTVLLCDVFFLEKTLDLIYLGRFVLR